MIVPLLTTVLIVDPENIAAGIDGQLRGADHGAGQFERAVDRQIAPGEGQIASDSVPVAAIQCSDDVMEA